MGKEKLENLIIAKLKDGSSLEVRHMQRTDKKRALDFYSQIPDDDQEYARGNIFGPDGIDKDLLSKGKSKILLGFLKKELAGIASLQQDFADGSEHVGYIRVSVAAKFRGKGVASVLVNEIYTMAGNENFEKLYAEIVSNQHLNLQLFTKKLGFKREAVLHDHVKDRSGKKFDLIILSSDPRHLIEELKRRTHFDFLFSNE